LTKSGKLLSKDFHSLGSQPRIIPSIERCGGCPISGLSAIMRKYPLYQFLQPAIGGKGQFLKASCHRGGPDRAALKGILWDSTAINSRGSEVPTRPRK
jgi:hypothetical protein